MKACHTFAKGARLAYDTMRGQPTEGIPSKGMNIMEHAQIERLAGVEPGSYRREPEHVYLEMQRAVGACMIHQYIPLNPLTMEASGYGEEQQRTATTGVERIELDGMAIDSPEAAVEHMERFVLPMLRRKASEFDEDARVREIVSQERAAQELFGGTILKAGYGFVRFPHLDYGRYGYSNYFMAYALYPEVVEKSFSLQADLNVLENRAAARACVEGDLSPLYLLDHDMADSRGTLVDVKSLDRLWFPHFSRAIEPMLSAGVRMLWHCDGNLMQMVPRLIECGLGGFQGFQYEDGMDYEAICRMKTRDGAPLVIEAGVSVTTTLPHGTPDGVRRQLKWLVDAGPETGLFLGASSSVTPGVPSANIDALIEGLSYYREHGRG